MWPVRPNPVPDDETFTSWVSRVALGQGLPPQTFYVQALGWKDVWSKDLDLFDDEGKIDFLAKMTGKDPEILKGLKLDDERFIVNSSGFSSSQEFTTFCPDCLNVKTPYFRKAWRSVLVATCAHHGTFLQSRCGACFAPIRLLARTDTIDLKYCSDCEVPLGTKLKKVLAPDYLNTFTCKIMETLQGHWFELQPGYHVHPQLFLDALPVLADIVCRNEVWEKLYDYLGLNEYFGKPSLLYFHRRESFVDRCVLLLALTWILSDWPAHFTWAVADLPLKTHLHLVYQDNLPYWLWSVVKEHFDLPGEFRTDVEHQTMLRMISEETLSEKTFYSAFGQHHHVRVGRRNLKNFQNIYKETIKFHACTFP